jgi:hypothetical protein
MNEQLVKAIGKAVQDLIEVIQDVDDDNPPVEISDIHITKDSFNTTHLVVWAEVATKERPGSIYPYKYAVYINKETCQTETDGY